MKAYCPNPQQIQRNWYLIDAEGQVLGRLVSTIAMVLRGKHKPIFTPHIDTGDFIVVINAAKVKFSGRKLSQKYRYYHTMYPGGLKKNRLDDLMRTKPTEVLRDAVQGMLPKTTLGHRMLKKLKVYAGNEHPHSAQQPQLMRITTLKTLEKI